MNLNPISVFFYFSQIASIPHGSGNTRALANYCTDFAEEHYLDYKLDKAGNISIFAPASKGYENAPTVMIQGHLDMVCEKTPMCEIDFETDPIELVCDGEYISANGTTLGADDGIAVAMALALLDDDEIPHPALEVLLTTDEEIGMLGASEVDLSNFKSEYLLNLDSEEEGTFLIGCAGGFRFNMTLPLTEINTDGDNIYNIEVSGLKGGHSGTEINKNRVNAALLIIDILEKLGASGIGAFSCGSKDNAIPSFGTATFSTPRDMIQILSAVSAISSEYAEKEPDIKINVRTDKCETLYSPDEFFNAAHKIPNGVLSMSKILPDTVETSSNLGTAVVKDNNLLLTFCARSSSASQLKQLKEDFISISKKLGAGHLCSGEYEPWECAENSELQELIATVYEEMFGCKARFETIHAGVECGTLTRKLGGAQAVSFGPQILDIHTVSERLNIESVSRTWDFLTELLKRIK